jgi:putative NADH-flavin reductase
MKISVFGATGALGRECAEQCLAAGHEVVALARSPEKLSEELRGRVTVVQGDGLVAKDVARALEGGVEAVLFAIGIDKQSPEDLCTDITRHILAAMPGAGVQRFVWCGGGSTLLEQDQIGFGAKFVEWFAATFMSLRHRDKEHQIELLNQNLDRAWIGIRPLQMRKGPRKGLYRVGFDTFSGMSAIHFADCAHAMVNMLDDDTWLRKAPIIQY